MIETIVNQSASAATRSGSAGIPARHDPMPSVGLCLIESGSNVYGIALGRNDEFIAPASDDRERAILKTRGAELSLQLRQVLPFIASSGLPVDTLLAEIVERLLRNDALIAPQRVRSPAATQVELSADEWMAQVRAWASSFPQRDGVVDDSRESIYGDRV